LFFGVYLIFAACLLLFDLLGALTVFLPAGVIFYMVGRLAAAISAPANQVSLVLIMIFLRQLYQNCSTNGMQVLRIFAFALAQKNHPEFICTFPINRCCRTLVQNPTFKLGKLLLNSHALNKHCNTADYGIQFFRN